MKQTRTYKYHYVYRITNIITQMYYYGDRSCNCHPSEDIGLKYFSSSTLKYFIIDQKENPQDYKYKIIKIFETSREDAKQLEIELHERFNVKSHTSFINKANQRCQGFSYDPTGKKLSLETKIKISIANKGKSGMKGNKNPATWKSTQIKMKQSRALLDLHGSNNPNFNNKWSNEQKYNLRETKRKNPYSHTLERKNKISENSSGKGNGRAKKWCLTSSVGEKYYAHGDLRLLCEKLGLVYGVILSVYSGKKIVTSRSKYSKWKLEEISN